MIYIAEPNTESEAVNIALEKLNKKMQPPRVNLPALARRDEPFMSTWIADEGYVFVSSDFVSLEPSVTASFAEDYKYRYATCDGVGLKPYIDEHGVLMIDDVYLMTASVMPGIKDNILKYFAEEANRKQWVIDSEVCKSHPLIKPGRKAAKPACLGFNYGMGPKRFVSQSYDAGSQVSEYQAKAMYTAYWKLFSGIQKFVKQIEAYMRKNQFIENPFGYRLTTDPHKGYNAFIQSTASGVLDVFNLKFFPQCPDAIFVAIVHDEVIYQIPIDKIDEVKRIQDRCVESLNKDLRFKVPMRLGFTTAKDFAGIK